MQKSNGGGEGTAQGSKESKQIRNERVTRHFVFLLVPWRRIRGSNNLNVCARERERGRARDRSDSTAEVTVRWEGGVRRREKFSERWRERPAVFSVCLGWIAGQVCVCARLCVWGTAGSRVAFFEAPPSPFFFFFSSFSSVLFACSSSLLSSLLQLLLLPLRSFRRTYLLTSS